MYKSNLAYADYPAEDFAVTAANAATIESTGAHVYASARVKRRNRRPTVASFKDIYAADLRTFRIY